MTRKLKSTIFLACILPLLTRGQDPAQQDPTQADPVGVDVFNVATQGGDPGPGPGPGGFIPPSGGPGQPGGKTLTLDLGKLLHKSSDPCHGHFTPVQARQYFEMAAHPNQWLCAADGISPGIHRVCMDLQSLPGKCYDPNHQPPWLLQVVQTCLNINSQCGQLLHQVNCADIYRLQSELLGGVRFPAPGSPETALANWTPLYLARRLPTLIGECQSQGFRPPSQNAKTTVQTTGDFGKGFVSGYSGCLGDTGQNGPVTLATTFQQALVKISGDVQRQDYLSAFQDTQNAFGQAISNFIGPMLLKDFLRIPGGLQNEPASKQGGLQGYHFCQATLIAIMLGPKAPGIPGFTASLPGKAAPGPIGPLAAASPRILTGRALRSLDLIQIFGREREVPTLPNGTAPSRLSDLTWLKSINTACGTLNCVLNFVAVDQGFAGRAILPTFATYTGFNSAKDVLSSLYGNPWNPVASGSIQEVISDARKGGNGARGGIHGDFLNAKGEITGSHIFNYVNDNGNLRFFDAQAPGIEITTAQAQAIKFNGGAYFMRTNY